MEENEIAVTLEKIVEVTGKFFFCPKCKSSLVVCSKDELVVRGI